MRGRTNAGGGGNDIFIDGNVIEGVVADADGIISGDFVQKKLVGNTISSSEFLQSYFMNHDNSSLFQLDDGTFGVFGCSGNCKTWYLWNFDLSGQNASLNMVYDFTISDLDSNSKLKIEQKEDGTFLLFALLSLSRTLKVYSIKLISGVVSVSAIGSVVITTGLVDNSSQNTISRVLKVDDNNFVVFLKTYISGTHGYYPLSVGWLSLSSGTVTFTKQLFLANSNGYNAFLDDAFVYENGFVEVFYSMQSTANNTMSYYASFLDFSEDEAVEVNKTSRTSAQYGRFCYLGNNKNLCLLTRTATKSSIKAKIFTFTENSSVWGDEYEIASFSPFSSVPSLDNTLVHKTNGDFFITLWANNKMAVGKLVDNEFGDLESFEVSGSSGCYSLDLSNGKALFLVGASLVSNPVKVFTTRYDNGFFESIGETTLFSKSSNKIDGVAKQSGAQGDVIEVYIPKT